MDDIKAGDVVILKSGSPRMTVEDIGAYRLGETEDQAKCVWFDGSKKMEDIFALNSLEKEL